MKKVPKVAKVKFDEDNTDFEKENDDEDDDTNPQQKMWQNNVDAGRTQVVPDMLLSDEDDLNAADFDLTMA